MPCSSCQNNFINNLFGFLRVFFQIVSQYLRNCSRYSRSNFAVTQFCFRLSFKLRLLNLYRNNRCQTFTEIIACNIEFQLIKHSFFLSIVFQGSCHTHTESGQVCTTLMCVYVIHIRVKVFCKSRIVLHSYLYRNSLLLSLNVYRLRNKMFSCSIKIRYEILQSIL